MMDLRLVAFAVLAGVSAVFLAGVRRVFRRPAGPHRYRASLVTGLVLATEGAAILARPVPPARMARGRRRVRGRARAVRLGGPREPRAAAPPRVRGPRARPPADARPVRARAPPVLRELHPRASSAGSSPPGRRGSCPPSRSGSRSLLARSSAGGARVPGEPARRRPPRVRRARGHVRAASRVAARRGADRRGSTASVTPGRRGRRPAAGEISESERRTRAGGAPRPRSRRRKACTHSGSSCEPLQRRSSSTARRCSTPARYGRSLVIAS